MTKFFIIATGYNCQDKVAKCIESVRNQTYQNFEAVFVDDGSEDGTRKEISMNITQDDKSNLLYSNLNFGAAFHRYQAIYLTQIDPETVIVLLGLDDELKPNALERVAKEYDQGAWCTYGNWIGSDGYTLPDGFLQYSDAIHRQRYYRSVQYKATALNTFKRHLFDHFTEDDFKYQGEWIKATTESNLMLSCLEMCGKDRIGVIEDIIYLYNNESGGQSAARRFGREYQDKIYRNVKKKPIRNLLP